MRILIADDNPQGVELLEAYLSGIDCDIATAADGEDTLGKVANFSYHSGQYLPDWHPWERVADYYVSNPETGGAREIVPFELTWLTEVFGWPASVSGERASTMDVGAAIDDTYVLTLRYPRALGVLRSPTETMDAVVS